MEEEWVQILPYLKNKKIVPCGSSSKRTKACRPLHRIDSTTPITLHECIDIHGKPLVKKLATQKNKDMDGRLYWKRGVFYSS
jgi:hypothetical protein